MARHQNTFTQIQIACRDGGIGRRTGLKIQRPNSHAGSIPARGTILRVAKNALRSFMRRRADKKPSLEVFFI